MASRKRRPGLTRGLQEIFDRKDDSFSLDRWLEDPIYGPLPPQPERRTQGPPEQTNVVGPTRPRDRGPNINLPEMMETEAGREPNSYESYLFKLLPSPEYIEEIKQAQYPAGYRGIDFLVVRPDNNEMFHGQGNSRSTRVQAMQWIPTVLNEKTNAVRGDIFVAFARPSRGKSALFVYIDKSEDEWKFLKTTKSIGRAINGLGLPEKQEAMTDEMYKEYRDLHPGTTSWIFDKSWMSIREPNTIGTIERLESRPKREKEAVAFAESDEGKALREAAEKKYGRFR